MTLSKNVLKAKNEILNSEFKNIEQIKINNMLKFSTDKIHEHCYKILNKSYHDLSWIEQSLLQDEYSRMSELPSIDLVSDEKLWDDIEWCDDCMMYFFSSSDFDHEDHDTKKCDKPKKLSIEDIVEKWDSGTLNYMELVGQHRGRKKEGRGI